MIVCNSHDVEIVHDLLELGVIKEKILIADIMFNSKGIFFSQFNEDVITIMLLNLVGVEWEKVTYLELGTNHPAYLNNTYSLYMLGAKGILVEANKKLKQIIETVRPRDVLINKAVSLDGQPIEFYELEDDRLSTTVYSGLDKEFCDKLDAFSVRSKNIVESITINDVFNLMEKTPEVLSIDIEGCDYEILKQINFNMLRPIVIIVEMEAWGMKEQSGRDKYSLLKSNHYELVHMNGVNAIFIDEKYESVVKQYLVK